jgi:tetratricopeptide (TPR) repeat protein
MGKLDEAKQEFQKAMGMTGNRDTYAFIGLANINYAASCIARHEMNVQEQQLRSGLQKYFGILEIDESNTYASLGIANILTEYGKVDEAKEIYKLLANSESDQPISLDAMVNQSHLLMAEGNFDNAINLYQACLAKSPDNLDIWMYLSKAHFRKQNFEACKQITIAQLAKNPNDLRLKYNLAFCLYKEADSIFNMKARKVAQTRQAIANLKQAQSLFREILTVHQQAGGQAHTLVLPIHSRKEHVYFMHRCLLEIAHKTEETMSYLNDTL